MRYCKTLARRTSLLVLTLMIAACGSSATYNPTTVPGQIDQERLEANPIKTVVIAHVNLSGVSRNYLEKEAPRIDAQV
ncbi:MAG: hypothetical protein ACPG1A_09835, partial [Halioglobus sp.]